MPRIFGVSMRIGYENLLEGVGATLRLCMVGIILHLLHGTLRVVCCYESLIIAGIYLNFDIFRGFHRDVHQGFVPSVLVQLVGVLCFFCAACVLALRGRASVLLVISEIGCNLANVGGSIAANTQHYLYHVVVYTGRFVIVYTLFSFEGVVMK